eukprot:gene10726-12485_t
MPEATDMLVKKICDWVVTSNTNGKNAHTIDLLPRDKMEIGTYEILEVVLHWIIEEMKEPSYLLLIGIYFADKYVKKVGLRQSQVLWLILTSYNQDV